VDGISFTVHPLGPSQPSDQARTAQISNHCPLTCRFPVRGHGSSTSGAPGRRRSRRRLLGPRRRRREILTRPRSAGADGLAAVSPYCFVAELHGHRAAAASIPPAGLQLDLLKDFRIQITSRGHGAASTSPATSIAHLVMLVVTIDTLAPELKYNHAGAEDGHQQLQHLQYS